MEKIGRLEGILRGLGSVLVAYSGGGDSTLLLYMASKILGQRAAAITVSSPLITGREIERAVKRAGILRAAHRVIPVDILASEEVVSNPPQRCYHCKHLILTRLKREAASQGLSQVIDATHTDDLREYRPGLLASMELGIRSPLAEAGFSKEDVRRCLGMFHLPGADEPSNPCLATRIPFGRPLTPEALARVESAEAKLLDLGFAGCRVRDHHPVAVVEVPPEMIERLTAWPTRRAVAEALRAAGYIYAAADLEGYRPGSLVEIMPEVETGREHEPAGK